MRLDPPWLSGVFVSALMMACGSGGDAPVVVPTTDTHVSPDPADVAPVDAVADTPETPDTPEPDVVPDVVAEPDATPDDTEAQDGGDLDVVTPDTPYWPPVGPAAWETIAADAAGFTDTGLAALRAMLEEHNTTTFMLLFEGRIVAEWYFGLADVATRRDVASVQKSFTSTLIGLARDRGLLTLDDTVSSHLGAGWSNASVADEAAITLRHLMTHTSGLSPTDLTRAAAPGAVFRYNTPAYQKLRGVLEAVATENINTLSRAWLFDSIGVRGEWFDRGGTDPTGDANWGLRLTARDMARFGLFALRGGAWADDTITVPGWFAEAWTPSAAKADYGLLWWLQGVGSLAGEAPADLVSALGAGDQKIYVVPSLGIVVTRQGRAGGTGGEAESDFDLLLARALAAARK